MRTRGWSEFRQPPRPPQRTYLPTAGRGLDGVDRTKLDEKTLDRQLERELKEVWDDFPD